MLRQLIAPALVAVLLLSAALFLVIGYFTDRLDDETRQLEIRLVSGELTNKLSTLEQLALDTGDWDDAYLNAVQTFNINWIETTVGDMTDSIDYLDAVIYIGPDRQRLYGRLTNDLPNISDATYSQLVNTILAKVEPDRASAQTFRGYLSHEAGTFLYGASTVGPNSESLAARVERADRRHVMVFLENITATNLAAIEEKLEISELSLSKTITGKDAYVRLDEGSYMAWQPNRPGAGFIKAIRLPLFAFAVILAAIGLFFYRRAAKVIGLYQKADRTRAIFLSAVGHELRTPINSLTNGAALLGTSELSVSQQAHLQSIEGSAQELSKKVNQILEYTRLETADFELENAVFDVRLLLEEVTETVLEDAVAPNVKISLNVPVTVKTKITADRNRLRQMIELLVSEALSTVSCGTLAVKLTTIPLTRQKDSFALTLNVTPTSGNSLQPITTQFLDAGLDQRQDGGASWGLMIVHHLAIAMGGTLSVHTQNAEQHTLTLHLPLEVDPHPQLRLPMNEYAGGRALVVDNDSPDRQLLTDALSAFGMTVAVAASPEQAIAAIETWPENDDQMNLAFVNDFVGMQSGMVLVGQIKPRLGKRQISFVLMSNDPKSCDTSVLQNMEFAGLLPLPLFMTRLSKFVLALCDRSSDMPPNYVLGAQLSSAPASSAPKKTLASLSILIVEDNPVSLLLIQKIVTSWGCKVATATDGAKAVELMLANDFDCILMDFNMPGMTGAEATKIIRKMGYTVPVIVLSAASSQQDIDECTDAGMTAFVSKPVAPMILQRQVIKWTGAESETN